MMGRKKGLLILWLSFLLVIVVSVFWYNEWRYTQPTPVPLGYQAVPLGTRIDFGNQLAEDRPVLLHFFNPNCPCSRFNIKHVKELIDQYGQKVNFAIVLVTEKAITEKEVQEKYGLNVPVLKDSSLAQKCGVYSTPQAVILSTDRALYYRGNYNKSRYCTDKKSNYAQIALERLLDERAVFRFDQFALKAYGCELPGCTKQ